LVILLTNDDDEEEKEDDDEDYDQDEQCTKLRQCATPFCSTPNNALKMQLLYITITHVGKDQIKLLYRISFNVALQRIVWSLSRHSWMTSAWSP